MFVLIDLDTDSRNRSVKTFRLDIDIYAMTSHSEVLFASDLVRILSPSRADDYKDWMNLGWVLHNISDSLLSDYVDFSRQSAKFVEGVCEAKWAKMRSSRMGLGSLIMWAKQDSPAEAKSLHAAFLKAEAGESESPFLDD